MNTQLKDLFPYCCEAINQSKQKQFEVLLSERIRSTINAHSLLRRLGEVTLISPGEQSKYRNKIKSNIFYLPNIGHIPHVFNIDEDDDIYVPIFRPTSSFDIDLKYIENTRYDIFDKAIKGLINWVINLEDQSFFRTLVVAATSVQTPTQRRKTLKPITSSKFSLDLIKKIIKDFEKDNKILTHILISERDRLDLAVELEELHNIYSNTWNIDITTEDKIYPVSLITCKELGVWGNCNINSFKHTYNGIFKFSKGVRGKFNDYKPKNKNIIVMDGEIPISTPGETQIYAFDLNKESPIKVPIRQQFELYPDPVLHREKKLGYYGWEEIGIMIQGNDNIKMVVIDRTGTEVECPKLNNSEIETNELEDKNNQEEAKNINEFLLDKVKKLKI